MKHDLCIRADGNRHIGLGHLVRCSALAHMLKDDFSIKIFCISIPISLEQEFNQGGFEVILISYEEDFFEKLSPEKIVVIDGYDFDSDYQRRVRETGCKLVCIDDLHDREFVADLIINHSPGIMPEDYNAQPYTRFALGPEYALLRPSFLEQAKRGRRIEKIETLLITFGGADPKNLTVKTLQAALKYDTFKKLIIVTGAAYVISEGFTQLILSDHRIEQRYNLSEGQMLKTLLEADLAVLPASGILFEALAAGCNVISGYYTNNQLDNYRGFKNLGCISDGHIFDDLDHVLQTFINSYSPQSHVKLGIGQSTFEFKGIFKSLISV